MSVLVYFTRDTVTRGGGVVICCTRGLTCDKFGRTQEAIADCESRYRNLPERIAETMEYIGERMQVPA